MKVVYKYRLDFLALVVDRLRVLLPVGAKILFVGTQSGTDLTEHICLWAEVDPEEDKKEEHQFRVFGTGQQFVPTGDLKHVGTVLHGLYVWHIYEQT